MAGAIRVYVDTRVAYASQVTISVSPQRMQITDGLDGWNFFTGAKLLMRLSDDQARELYSALRAFYSDPEAKC